MLYSLPLFRLSVPSLCRLYANSFLGSTNHICSHDTQLRSRRSQSCLVNLKQMLGFFFPLSLSHLHHRNPTSFPGHRPHPLPFSMASSLESRCHAPSRYCPEASSTQTPQYSLSPHHQHPASPIAPAPFPPSSSADCSHTRWARSSPCLDSLH